MSNLETLRKLTAELPAWANPVPGGEVTGVKSVCGDITLQHIFYEEGVGSACWSYSTDGAVMEEHSHEEDEYFIIFTGSIELTINGETIVFDERDMVHIPPGTPHSVKYNGATTRILAVTIPDNEGMPHGRHKRVD